MTSQPEAIPAKTRVLLVDDHAVVRKGMTAMINEEPDLTVCGEAEGVHSALDVIERVTPDIALIDLSIKDGDGLELIRAIRKRWKHVALLVLSMYDESVYAERALRAGARGYIMKAQAARTVMDAIRCVLRGEVYLSPEMRERMPRLTEAAGSRANEGPRPLDQLSDRELQVLRCLGKGWNSHEIGEELFVSPKTVDAHREHIKHKLKLASSGDLLRFAIEHNRMHH
jgi:DNA-binding NarL/FixJ family response regulator